MARGRPIKCAWGTRLLRLEAEPRPRQTGGQNSVRGKLGKKGAILNSGVGAGALKGPRPLPPLRRLCQDFLGLCRQKPASAKQTTKSFSLSPSTCVLSQVAKLAAVPFPLCPLPAPMMSGFPNPAPSRGQCESAGEKKRRWTVTSRRGAFWPHGTEGEASDPRHRKRRRAYCCIQSNQTQAYESFIKKIRSKSTFLPPVEVFFRGSRPPKPDQSRPLRYLGCSAK